MAVQGSPPLIDVVLAGAVLAIGVVEVWHNPWTPVPPDARLLTALTTICIGVAVAWWRSAPLLSVLSVMVPFVLAAVALAEPMRGLGVMIAWLLTTFGVAAYGSPRGRLAGLAVATAAGAVAVVADEPAGSADVIAALLFSVALPWLAGYAVAHRRTAREVADGTEAAFRAAWEAAVREERSRIARELHDIVSHAVSVVIVQAEVASAVLERRPNEARSALATIESTGREALAELRRLLGVLRNTDAEPTLAPQPGVEAVAELVENLSASGLRAHLRLAGTPRPVPAGVGLAAYRIVQESLTNVLRHAPGAASEVSICYEDGALVVKVENAPAPDGSRRPAEAGEVGHGLIGLRERAALYGGQCRAGRRPDGGFSVWAELPTRGV